MGKTSLAIHWAHRVAPRFPDGQLYTNLRGFDPTGTAMTPAEAIRGFLNALDVPPDRIPAGMDAQIGLYRSLLVDRRVLIVLDNARDADSVRPLLPGKPGCAVVVTSRNQLNGLLTTEGADLLVLDVLSKPEARELLARRVGAARVAREPAAVYDIVTLCARLPLALAVVAARATTQPRLDLSLLADELRGGGHLDVLYETDAATDLRSVFSWSYRTLDGQTARLFRLLGVHPGPDISPTAAASLAGVTPSRAHSALADLVRANLLAEHTPRRFTFHDLLRAYASELARAHDAAADRESALARVLDHYLHTAHRAALLLNPHLDSVPPAPPHAGVTPTELNDASQATAWFGIELATLHAAIRHALAEGFHAYPEHLAWTLWLFLTRCGRWNDWVAIQHMGLASARLGGDRAGQARAHRGLAYAHARAGRHDTAEVHHRQALDLYRDLEDHAGQAHIHLNRGTILKGEGQYHDAVDQAEQAIALYRAAGQRSGEARALNLMGSLRVRLGDAHRGLAACEMALAVVQEIGDRQSEARAWDYLGEILLDHLNDHRRAISCFQRAIDLFRAIGDQFSEADVVEQLGDAYRIAGKDDKARDAWQQALTILDELGHSDEVCRAKLDQIPR